MLAILVLAFSSCRIAYAQVQPIIIGVLEDTPGHYSGDPHYRSVRVVFRKEDGEWRAFPSDCLGQKCVAGYPSSVNWTIAFDGRDIGRVTTRNPDGFRFYGDVGQQQITSADLIPTIGKPSQEYAGFLNGPVYRPLIANSKSYFGDPEQWKPAQLTPGVVGLLRKQFRQMFPKVSNCANPEESVDKPWVYQDSDIKIMKTYSSKENWSVARVRLEEYRCDGPADDPFVDQRCCR